MDCLVILKAFFPTATILEILPFSQNTTVLFFQVDMKIMYYELIRMLIDYERKNHPETYDATKTVGKIEGYQELTNKLQR